MAKGLMTALDLQKPPVNDLCGQGGQMVLTLKMTFVSFVFSYILLCCVLLLAGIIYIWMFFGSVCYGG
jgi:hypothetical protein